ncbi:MAG: archaeosortase/exosortase family protein [Deltaproteobacteria bacterium]|nr:archaeosortase/exosortase family protein [Deltaproteobacteria bacterium]
MNVIPSVRSFFQANKTKLRFCLLFVLFFFLAQLLYHHFRPTLTPYIVHRATAGVGSGVINLLAPSESTTALNGLIYSQKDGFKMIVGQGCDGVESLLLVIAALAAFDLRLKQKVGGILAGAGLIYVVNLTRIVGLYFTLRYRPDDFDFAHIYMGQTVVILVGLLFFVCWIHKFSRPVT